MIVKNTKVAKDYLNEILNDRNHYEHEQDYFWKNRKEFIQVAKQRAMNSYDTTLPGLNPEGYDLSLMQWKKGDFFIHWPAQNMETRLECYRKMVPQIIGMGEKKKEELIACCQPGRIGDSLFILPAVRELCRIHNCKADMYLQPHCNPAKEFFEYQSYVNKVITTAKEKESQRYQNFTDVPNAEQYKKVFEISWRKQPEYPLAESFAECAGLPRDIGRDIRYEVPEGIPDELKTALKGKTEYVVFHTRGADGGGFKSLFDCVIEVAPWPVVVVGKQDESLMRGINMTGCSFLDMARIIANCKSYVGMFSSPLVIAQGFEMPKTCVFDGETWWPKQIIKDGETEYLVKPTIQQIIESANRKLRVKRVQP